MNKAELLRRIVHMTAVVFLVYYLLPEELLLGFYKWYGVVVIVIAALIVEALRLRKGITFFGMRDYEKKRICAFAWFAIGMGAALLWFEMRYVVPVVIGMAFIDPLIGEIKGMKARNARLYPVLPSILYGIIVFSCLLLLSEMSIVWLMLFAFLATFSAISAERWDLKGIDDDFLMIVIPLVVLSALDYVLSVLMYL